MNSAERLLAIYDKLLADTSDKKMHSVWANVLDAPETDQDFISDAQRVLRGEIDAVRRALNDLELPDDLQEPGLTRLREAAASHPRDPWKGLKGNLTPPECRKSLALAVWLLRGEVEDDMDRSAYDALTAELDALEAAASSPDVSTFMRAFVLRQTSLIRGALRLYVVAGAKPISDALRTVAGDLKLNEKQLDSELANGTEASKGLLAKTGEVVKKTAETCDRLDKIKKFGDTCIGVAQSVYPYIQQGIDYLSKP